MSETDSKTDISQSSKEDSGIHTSFRGLSDLNQSQPSDMLEELFQSNKKLREAETQVRSLSLILEHESDDDARIDHAVFQVNKSSLEQEIMKIKKEIRDKELVLQKMDMKLFEYYLGSIKDETNSKSPKVHLSQNEGSIKGIDNSEWLDISQNESVKNLNEREYSRDNVELEISQDGLENEDNSLDDDQYFESSFENSFDKEYEIAKLRRALAETRQKHKEERNDIMKQLKALQITTVQGETNWKCVMKEKQLKIEELTRKNSELQTKHAEVSLCLKNCEKLKQKEGKECDRRKKKDEKIILSLRTQNSSMTKEMKQLLGEIKELKNFKEELNESLFIKRNEELEKDLCDKNQALNEKNRIIEDYSTEIKETNLLVNKLVMDVNCLKIEKENLNKFIEEIKTQNIKNLEQVKDVTLDEKQLKFENVEMLDNKAHVGIQTDESRYKDDLQRMKEKLEDENINLVEQLEKHESFLECMKENEIKLQKECETWKNKSLQKERTIQDLTISLRKTTAAFELSCERKIEKYEEIHARNKGKFVDSLIGMLKEITGELNGLEEDFIKHKENVCSLQKIWRKYKDE